MTWRSHSFSFSRFRDIDSFLKSANKLLDTPAKKSLWFFLMPILEEDHQDYVRKVLHLDYQPEDYMMLNSELTRSYSTADNKSQI